MNEEHTPPRTVLGIPVKILLIVVVLLLGLFVVSDRLDMNGLLETFNSSRPDSAPVEKSVTGAENEIVATPEMIKRAAEEVQTEKLKELESAENILPTDRFFYVIELVNGKDLEAVDLTVQPDTVILTSAGGTVTTIPRTSVKKINRFKLDG